MSPENTARVTTVDGLRGLLAALVMLAHVCNDVGDPRFIPFARLCVMAFFGISGYVLTRGWRGRYFGFLVRRALRLWPVYALCLGVGGWLSANPPAASLYVWFPLTLQAEQLPQDPAAWSLFVEVWAMPFMPIFVWLGRRPRFALAAVAFCLAAQIVFPALYFGAFFIIGSYLADRNPASALLDSRPVQWLGRISYSLYLSHVIVFGVIKFHAPGLFIYLCIPAALAVAHALCVAVERPSIVLSRLAGRWVERAPALRLRPAAA
jgi:peptidoglycan/LPS O-acetylase OafA/YrhL